MIIRRRERTIPIVMDAGLVYGGDPLVVVLGGTQAVPVAAMATDSQKGEVVRIGLPKRAALHVQALLGLTAREMSSMIDMSYRTYQRKKVTDMLGLSSTEQLIEIAEVIADALQIFKSTGDVVTWLNTPLVGLAGQKPMGLLDNVFGIRQVRQALGRLAHGIAS
jgi:putative toxin-antitoxin system antitoxin component (TIGR02293 family)